MWSAASPKSVPVAPHTRGWTAERGVAGGAGHGCPAHAGMDPTLQHCCRSATRLPRTRGDGPAAMDEQYRGSGVAPHTRGWTVLSRNTNAGSVGCPAHAGMDPTRAPRRRPEGRLPRTRGDGPRPRGLTSRPARVAPHTRGWTDYLATQVLPRLGCPAHAGMDRAQAARAATRRRLPRTRGDGPRPARQVDLPPEVAPHTRGWTPSTLRAAARSRWLPRTRGDGPPGWYFKVGAALVAPHTRGWTDEHLVDLGDRQGCPAHAGMDRR